MAKEIITLLLILIFFSSGKSSTDQIQKNRIDSLKEDLILFRNDQIAAKLEKEFKIKDEPETESPLQFSINPDDIAILKIRTFEQSKLNEAKENFANFLRNSFKEITLPHTKINITYGLIKYEMAVKKVKYKARGIIPDYKIQPAINDIMNNHDVQMNYALKLTKQ